MIQYAKEFLTLQVRFAQKIAVVSNQTLAEAIIDYTILRRLFNLQLPRYMPDPPWDQFIEGLYGSDNPEDWTYNFYLQRTTSMSETPDDWQFFGCFSYVYPLHRSKRVRLHFENRETSDHGTLSKERIETRKSELSAMFRYIQTNYPYVETVRGDSWLYNIPAYRRLFPPDYVKTAKPVGYETNSWTLWGQFVARSGSIRQPATTQFLECLNNQKTVEDCLQCFPYQVLRPECPIEIFYDFYNL